MDSAIHRIGTAKVQRFIGKGIFADSIRRWKDSPIYYLCAAEVNLFSIVCNPTVLAGKGQTVTPLRGVLFPLGGKRH